MSTTVKFAYVILGGKDVKFVKRGKFGVVQGAIEGLFSVRIPFTHLSLPPLHLKKWSITREWLWFYLQSDPAVFY